MGLFKQRQPPEPPKLMIPNVNVPQLNAPNVKVPELGVYTPPKMNIPNLEKPPSVQDLEDVIDEISGTEAITVKGADGKKRRVVRRLPRTKEEEALFQKGQGMMKTALQNITNLYQYDPASAIDFQPIIDTFANINSERMNNLSQIADFGNIKNDIDDFKAMQSSLLKEQFLTENNRLNERLAHNGLEDSTVGREERNLLSRNQNLTSQQADLNAMNFGEGLADSRLNRNANLYNMNEMGRQSRLQAAQLDYELAQKRQADLEQMRQSAIGENQSQFQLAGNLVGSDLDRSMRTRANADAMNQMQLVNQAQMGNYNADVNRLVQQHQMQLDPYMMNLNAMNQQNQVKRDMYDMGMNSFNQGNQVKKDMYNMQLGKIDQHNQAQKDSYGMQMNQFNARPPSFGDFAMKLGGMGIGYALGGPVGAGIGGNLMSRGK